MRNWFTVLATGAASVALLTVPALTAPASADTLEEAVALAFENNPSLESERAFTRVADEAVTQAKALYGPNIDVTVTSNYTYSSIADEDFSQTSEGLATSAQVVLTQPLFTSGRLAANLNLAEATKLRQRENLRAVSQNVVLEVVSAYVNLRRDLELYQVATDTYELLLQQNNLTVSRLELRDATAPDVDQTRNRVEFAAARVIQARAAVESSAARYRNVVGSYPETLAPLPALPPLEALEQLYSAVELYNPEVRSALMTEIASRAQLAGARAQLGPQVDLSVAAGRTPLSSFSSSPYAEQVVAGITATMPIYQGGLLTSQVREASARASAAQEFVEQARRDARESLVSNWNQVRAAELSVPRFAAAVRSAEGAVSGVQQQQRAGIRTLRDVLDVTNDLFAARSAAAQAQADLYIAHVAVLRDAGTLSPAMFAPGAGYDPESYRPGGAWHAGLPLRTVLDPLDSLLVRDNVPDQNVQIENDPDYSAGERLTNPLVPISQ